MGISGFVTGLCRSAMRGIPGGAARYKLKEMFCNARFMDGLKMMNETFTVASQVACRMAVLLTPDDDDYVLRETKIGCNVLNLLQDMYGFKLVEEDVIADYMFSISEIGASTPETDFYKRNSSIYGRDEHIDIYAKPKTFWSVNLRNASPIMPIFSWRFGYTLRREDPGIHTFYSQPFTTPVWHCLFAMLLLVSGLFCILSRAEQRLLGGYIEGGLTQELLIAVGGYCQHYLPVEPMELTSRRIAFFSFFLFSYVIYSYYTSTLLSDLVHDKDNEMDLDMLADSDYGNIVLDTVAVIIELLADQVHNSSDNMTPTMHNFIEKKFPDIRVVNISAGLEELRTGKSALLSDYTSLYSTMIRIYDREVLCDLIEVDLFSNVRKYFMTAKSFKYIEEFKIGLLWATETGVLQRLLESNTISPLICHGDHFQAHFGHIQIPLLILVCSYIFCIMILMAERAHFHYCTLWPYVE